MPLWKPIEGAEGRDGFIWNEAGWIVFKMSEKSWWLAFHIMDVHNRYGPYEDAEEAQKWAEKLQEETDEINAERLLH